MLRVWVSFELLSSRLASSLLTLASSDLCLSLLQTLILSHNITAPFHDYVNDPSNAESIQRALFRRRRPPSADLIPVRVANGTKRPVYIHDHFFPAVNLVKLKSLGFEPFVGGLLSPSPPASV